jgi:hypothetical protein
VRKESCFNCESLIESCDCGSTEGYSSKGPVCPYCGYVEDDFSDGSLYSESTEEWNCSSCGKEYRVEVITSYDWRTQKAEERTMTAISVELLEKYCKDRLDESAVRSADWNGNYADGYEHGLRIVLSEINSLRLSPAPEGDGLLPCPLQSCGCEAELGRAFGDPYYVHSIECSECGICLSVTSTGETPPQSLFDLWNTRPTLAREWVPVSDGVKKYQTYIVKVRTKEGNLFVSTGICTGEEWERETPASEHQNIETCNFSDLGMQVIEYMPLPELAPQPPQQQQENGG